MALKYNVIGGTANTRKDDDLYRVGRDKHSTGASSGLSDIGGNLANALKDRLGAGGGGGGYAYPSFNPSDNYLKAMDYTNSLLEQLSSGRTPYTDKVQSMLSAIEGKGPFQYDFNTDPLFQSSLQSAMNKGQIAMQDTMGQAAALTGGYGSSYGQAVGNQAYNNMVQGAYDNLPDYYNMALDAYNSELANMYNMLDMYSTQDQIEYDRLANAYQSNLANANMLYDMDVDKYNRSLGAYNSSLKSSGSGSSSSKATSSKTTSTPEEKEVALKKPSTTEMNRGLKAYGEGEDSYNAWLDALGDGYDLLWIDDYMNQYGVKPLNERTFTNTKDTRNFFGGLDNNDRVTDQYDNEYKLKDLRDALMEEYNMTKSEANEFIKSRGLNGTKKIF